MPSHSFTLEHVREAAEARVTSWPSSAPADNCTCRNCGKTFAYSFNMVRHRRQCEGKYHLQCPACDRQFHRRDLYADHLRAVHGLQDEKRDTRL